MSDPTLNQESSGTDESLASKPFRTKLGIIIFLTALFFLNFVARLMMAPLMPNIEHDLGIHHGEAGAMFLVVTIGYFVTLIGSGFLSARIGHRWTIALSAILSGLSVLVVSFSQTATAMRFGLIATGLGAGLYLPSGIAVITSIVRKPNWGKALGIHEAAPNLSFILAPLAAEALMRWMSWRGVLAIIGALSVVGGLAFLRFGVRSQQRGQAANLSAVKTMAALPSFWVMILLYSMGVASQMGLFAMGPLFLITDRGMERTWANTLIGLTRISGLFMAFVSGWMSDRFGPKRTIFTVLALTGVASILLPVLPDTGLIIMFFVQPALAASFFPPAFNVLARIAPPHIRNVAVSLAVPFAFVIGGGLVPTAMGYLAEAGSFTPGIIMMGAYVLAGTTLVRFIRFNEESERS